MYWRQRLDARNLRGVSACIFQQLPDPPINPSEAEATGFQLTRQSPPQHRFADPPPHLPSSLSCRADMSVSLPSWVAGLRDMHVRLTCTASRFSSLFPHFSDASAAPSTSDVPPPVAPGTPDLSIVPIASSSVSPSWYPDAELERSSVSQHLLPSPYPYPSPAVRPPAMPDPPSLQHPPSLATPPSSNRERSTSPPPPLGPLVSVLQSPLQPRSLVPPTSPALAQSPPPASSSLAVRLPPASDSGSS